MSAIKFDEYEYPMQISFATWKKLFSFGRFFLKDFVVVIVFMSILALTNVFIPLMTRYAIDHFVLPRSITGLDTFIIIYGLILLFQIVSVYLFIYHASRIEYGMAYKIRQAGFERLQTLSLSFYDRVPVGYLMSRMTSDCNQLGVAFGWILVDIVWALVYLVASLVSMFMIHSKLTLQIILVLPILTVVSIYFQRKILAQQREVRKANSKASHAFNESIMGAKTIKSLVLEEETVRRFHKVSSDIRQKSILSAKLSAIYLPVVISISSIACAFAIVKGSNQVIAGFMTVGFLNAYVNYVISMFEPIHDIAASLSELQRMQASAERIIGLINTEADIVDDPEIIQTYGDFFNPKKENWPSIRGNVDFENVTFRYKGGEEVLNNFSLHVNAGENIAIVGPTGAGKSTLVNLLCRFYEPTEGNILIDGVDYRKRSQLWLQSNLGYVLQEPHLFSGTIKENIAYVKPDATMDEIVKAAKLVNAHSFIQKLDGGYDADVGEGGGKLSTGERQLISFARAVIHNPALLVLDEATSSVDAKTEQAIQHAIEAVLKNRTSFVIAHRLSTIRYATKIIVIDRGQVVEMGTHDELMKKQDFYWRLYTKQLIDERSRSALDTKDKE